MAAENNVKMFNVKYILLFSMINPVSSIDALVSIAFGPFRFQVCFLKQGLISFGFHLHRTMVYRGNGFEKLLDLEKFFE